MFLLKVCLLGDGDVGKTSLRERFLGKEFKSNYLMTVGADYAVKIYELNGKPIKYQIWNIAGQERFESVRSLFFQGSHGLILVFDITRPETLYNLKGWLAETKKYIKAFSIPIICLANKIDLDTHLNFRKEEVLDFLRELFIENEIPTESLKFYETSSKTGENVEKAFKDLAEMVIKASKISNEPVKLK